MTITLSNDPQKWLEAQVAAGNFSSIEEAVAIAITDLKAVAEDDLSWAKPHLNKARQSIAAGHVISGEDFVQELDAKNAIAAKLKARVVVSADAGQDRDEILLYLRRGAPLALGGATDASFRLSC